MTTHNIPFSKYKEKSALIIPNLQLPDFFSKSLKGELETAMVNEPSVFEPLKFYCIWLLISGIIWKYPLKGLFNNPKNQLHAPKIILGQFHVVVL